MHELRTRCSTKEREIGSLVAGGALTLGAFAPKLLGNWKWEDEFFVVVYQLVKGQVTASVALHAKDVPVPTTMDTVRSLELHNLRAPVSDIDLPAGPTWMKDVFGCSHAMLRSLPWRDNLNSNQRNTWYAAMHWGGLLGLKLNGIKEPREYVLQSFDYKTADGDPGWPIQIRFDQHFWTKSRGWSDQLETTMAFDHIGAHRVQSVEKTHGGEPLPFLVSLNGFSSLETRPHFGRYGADMYFTAAGVPALIVTPEGLEIERNHKQWQYWKFVWRSTLLSIITVQDHLYHGHFQVGGSLANNIRASVPADHPLRRFLSIFTYGTINVNSFALDSLLGSKHVLHRALPFKHFQFLNSVVEKSLPDPASQHRWLMNESDWALVPARLQTAPFFTDNRLLFKPLRRLVDGLFELYGWCGADGNITDEDVAEFAREVVASQLRRDAGPTESCSDFKWRLTKSIWIVTAWHRHVGTVNDYLVDPSLASFSWHEGEARSRPLQHMLAATINAATAMPQPKLNEDYSHVFAGMQGEVAAVKLWQAFRAQLAVVREEIARRNTEEREVPNWQSDPSRVECSIAV